MPDTFSFGESDAKHIRGAEACPECWDYPQPCDQEGCTGLKHSHFFDESWDGYTLSWCCDVCGDTDSPDGGR